jgi:hypothetical protein
MVARIERDPSRYKWTKDGALPRLEFVGKRLVSVPSEYQRPVEEDKVSAITASLSWPAFGVLSVVRREDESLWVFDGQHRLLAALRRTDVDVVPCAIYDMPNLTDEARAFLTANTNRRPVSTLARMNAAVLVGDQSYALTAKICDVHGRRLAGKSDSKAGRTVTCVAAMLMIARRFPDTLRAIFPVCDAVAGESPIQKELLLGAFWIERRMPAGASLGDVRWRARMIAVGVEALLAGARRRAAITGKGGEAVFGAGMLDAINFRLRDKLVLPGVEVGP